MISQSKFDNGIALLQQHFNRELCPQAIAIWNEYLNEHLDDTGFVSAVKQAIINLEFFPTAKRLVEFATTSKEAMAIADWQLVVNAARLGKEDLLHPVQERVLHPLTAIGGLGAVMMADERQLQKLEKQFITVYCSPLPKNKLLVQETVKVEPVAQEEPSPIPDFFREQIEQLKNKKSFTNRRTA